MDEMLKQLWTETIAELRRQADELGHELGEAVEDAAAYAAERTAHLSMAVGEPGFAETLIVERDNIAIYAGLQAVDQAEALDERMKQNLTVALNFGAKMLSLIL